MGTLVNGLSVANEWNNDTKALKLPTLLEGEALAVWLELPEEEWVCYANAKKAENGAQSLICLWVIFTSVDFTQASQFLCMYTNWKT